MGLLVTAGGLLVGAGSRPRRALADGGALPTRPATTPWSDRMPVPPVIQPSALTGPAPDPQQHQFWCSNPGQYAPKKIYQMTARQFTWRWGKGIENDQVPWGYESMF